MKYYSALIFFSFYLSYAFSAPTSQGLSVSANKSFRDLEKDLIELTGNVQIIYEDKHLRCDQAIVSLRAKSVDARGNVVLTSASSTVNAQRMVIDYESNSAVIFDGFVKNGNILFEGKYIIKKGDTQFLAEEGKFTACNNCPESWSFHGSSVHAQLGGYAYIRNSWLHFGGLPVIWLPYLVVPLKSERQTGLLPPEFENSSDGGFAFSESLFLRISKSQDATITSRNYAKRGHKGLLNYRYILGPGSFGELDMASIYDTRFTEEDRRKRYETTPGRDLNRWFLKYDHYFTLPENYIHRLQLNNASDLQYPSDFPLETKNHLDSAMENRTSLTKNSHSEHFSIDSSYYVNMLQSNPLGSNDDSVHRLPEINYSKTLTKLHDTDFMYSYDFNFTNFARSDIAWDDLTLTDSKKHLMSAGPTGIDCDKDLLWYNNKDCRKVRDGTYDEDRDLIRTGQRTNFQGTVTRVFQLGNALDFIPKVQFRETHYRFQTQQFSYNSRKYVKAETALRSTISRVYISEDPKNLTRFRHELVPEITLTTIPWINHPNHPFFGSRQEIPFYSEQTLSNDDLNGPYSLQFDYTDRVYDRKLASIGLINKIIRKRVVNNESDYKQVVWWKLAQSYDFHQATIDTTKKEPLSPLVSYLRMSFDLWEFNQTASHFPAQRVFDVTSSVKLLNSTGDYIGVRHDINNQVSPGTDPNPASRIEEIAFSLRKSVNYFDLIARTSFDSIKFFSGGLSSAGSGLKSYAWGVRVKLPGDCWNFTFLQGKLLDKAPYWKLGFDFNWDGKPKPVLPESVLDTLENKPTDSYFGSTVK